MGSVGKGMNETNGATSSSIQPVMCLERIGGHITKLLELHAQKSALQIVFVPGNPSVVIYYQEYLDVLCGTLKGGASVTTISHIVCVSRDCEDGWLFSLHE